MLATQYLLLYNLLMTAGWTMILVRVIDSFVTSRPLYPSVSFPLQLFQTGALLEVMHSLTGIVRSSASTTLLQVSSRLMLVWGVLHAVPAVRDVPTFTSMLLAWSLTEIPRYFYFTTSASGGPLPRWLIWLRYSTFIPLYPVGAISEAATLFAALPFIKEARLFAVDLPNPFNFAFDYYYFCLFILFAYLPGLPFMYTHMLAQRKKYVVPSVQKLAKTQ